MKTCPKCGGTDFCSYRVEETPTSIDGNGIETDEHRGEMFVYLDYDDMVSCLNCDAEFESFWAVPGEVDDENALQLNA